MGASCMDQLQELLAAAAKGPLSEDELMACDEVHNQYPNPCP